MSAEDFTAVGRDVECVVLARAVRWHVEHRVLMNGHKTRGLPLSRAMPRAKAQTAALMASPDEVEAQFYEALQQGDIDKLMAVWSDDDEIVCVHPGGPRVVGPAAIRAPSRRCSPTARIDAQPEKVRRLQTLGSAVHNVVERVQRASTQRAPQRPRCSPPTST